MNNMVISLLILFGFICTLTMSVRYIIKTIKKIIKTKKQNKTIKNNGNI